nr:hypothetical protein [Micromonospora polyrhachis]
MRVPGVAADVGSIHRAGTVGTAGSTGAVGPTGIVGPINERPYRRPPDPGSPAPATGETPAPAATETPAPAETSVRPAALASCDQQEDESGFVIHLPIHVNDLETAARLAYTVAGSLAFLPELDPGETTVSIADDQNNRHRVFCDRLLPDRTRCPRRFEHSGRCEPVDPGPDSGSVPRQWDGR